MEDRYLEAASKAILFNAVGIGEIPHVLDCLDASIAEYRKNETVIQAGGKFTGVCIVLEGQAAVVRESADGSRVVVNIFNVGDMFGEVLAFCGSEKWPMAIQTLTDCAIMFLHPEKILDMCERTCIYHKKILSNLVRVVSKKAFDLNRKVEYLSLKTINGKLSRYLLEQYRLCGTVTLTLPLSRGELADFLNISRPSMSRELGRMRDAGILEFYRESVRLIDVGALEALLEQ